MGFSLAFCTSFLNKGESIWILLILVFKRDIFKYDEFKKDANASLHIFNQLEMFKEWMMLNANTKTKLELRLTFVLARDSWNLGVRLSRNYIRKVILSLNKGKADKSVINTWNWFCSKKFWLDWLWYKVFGNFWNFWLASTNIFPQSYLKNASKFSIKFHSMSASNHFISKQFEFNPIKQTHMLDLIRKKNICWGWIPVKFFS